MIRKWAQWAIWEIISDMKSRASDMVTMSQISWGPPSSYLLFWHNEQYSLLVTDVQFGHYMITLSIEKMWETWKMRLKGEAGTVLWVQQGIWTFSEGSGKLLLFLNLKKVRGLIVNCQASVRWGRLYGQSLPNNINPCHIYYFSFQTLVFL